MCLCPKGREGRVDELPSLLMLTHCVALRLRSDATLLLPSADCKHITLTEWCRLACQYSAPSSGSARHREGAQRMSARSQLLRSQLTLARDRSWTWRL